MYSVHNVIIRDQNRQIICTYIKEVTILLKKQTTTEHPNSKKISFPMLVNTNPVIEPAPPHPRPTMLTFWPPRSSNNALEWIMPLSNIPTLLYCI